MKSLATLIKLQKTYVDEQRLHLAKLQARLEQIVRDIALHEIMKAREQVAAEQHREARATYGAFLKAAVKKGRELEKERQTAAHAVEIARDKLAQLFEEQKRYELAEAARLEAEAKEERRKERIELDEIGSVSFVRKKGK
jgi:hypothetical protein